MTKTELILGAVETAVDNLLYYDRKDDEELSHADIIGALRSGEIRSSALVGHFWQCLNDKVNESEAV